MDSTEWHANLELIAALIDGRVSGKDRARAMQVLSESDEALALFASAVRLANESGAKVSPIASSRRWRRWQRWQVLIPVAAAAAIAVIVVPTVSRRESVGTMGNQYAMELARDPKFANALTTGWADRGWSVTRGAPPVGGPSAPRGSSIDPKLAFRLGVRSVDVQVANRAGDTAVARRLTDEVLETLKVVAFSEAVGESYKTLESTLARESRDASIQRASEAERQLRDFLGSPMFSFGQWAGAAELAARTRDASFFTSRRAAAFTGTTGLAPEDIQALRQIDERVQDGLDEQGFDEVHQLLQLMIRRRGG
jgi:hypothetical protein